MRDRTNHKHAARAGQSQDLAQSLTDLCCARSASEPGVENRTGIRTRDCGTATPWATIEHIYLVDQMQN
jgi:hypothetical protein